MHSDLQNVINHNLKFMNKTLKKYLSLTALLLLFACKSTGRNENAIVLIKTTAGDIKVKLYDGTPLHRDNFIKLVEAGFYDGISFHRVIKDFMIQGGDPETKTGTPSSQSDTLNHYTIPAEFNNEYFHKKGALAAAREGNNVNPQMRSSGTQFYIVQGTRLTEAELVAAESRINNNIKQAMFTKFLAETADSARISGATLPDSEIQDKASMKMFNYLTTISEYKISPSQREAYRTTGGVPRLDGTYTVFGEVLEGLDIVDKIASTPTDPSDRPITDVRIIRMKVISK